MVTKLNKDGQPRANAVPASERQAVLDRWAAGMVGRAIAADLELHENRVQFIIRDARKAGDPRAQRRMKYAPRPYRTREGQAEMDQRFDAAAMALGGR
jgi:DNA-binding CsgD family transcriptional regulator